ncbi:STAS domain-containing protein [Prescottella soli]|uniref:STAS domain-containing protein n=1 Tax=Prescottella soli TaxID=1543852 RepID=UPI0032AEB5BA
MPDLSISANTLILTDGHTTDERSPTPLPAAALVIELATSLDMSTADGFRHAYLDLVDAASADGLPAGSPIVLDLSRVDFVSIEATSALIEAKELASCRGFDFKLVIATRGVEHALAATETRRRFSCHPTVESAVGSEIVGGMSEPTEHDNERVH